MEVSGRRRRGVAPVRRRSSGTPTPEADAPSSHQPPCQLCLRESNRYTVHHLVPKAAGGKLGPTADLCPTCHQQLHALFSEGTLAKELNTIDKIRANPQMAGYLRWARKQKAPTNFRARRANHRR